MKEEYKVITAGAITGLGFSVISKLGNAISNIDVIAVNKTLGLNKLQYLGITSSNLVRLELLVVGFIVAPIAGMAIGKLLEIRREGR